MTDSSGTDVSTTVTQNPDGSTTIVTRNPDGSTTTVTESRNRDGSTVTRTETRNADGSGITRTEIRNVNGSTAATTIAEYPDGSTVTTMTTHEMDGSTVVSAETRDADGSAVSTVKTRTAAGDITTQTVTTDTDGNVVSTITREEHTEDGGTRTIDTAETNADGSSSFEHREIFQNGRENSDSIHTDAGGTVTVDQYVKKSDESTVSKHYLRGSDGGLKLTEYETHGTGAIIPSFITINGQKLPVTTIGKGLFANNDTIVRIRIDKNITVIGMNAFRNAQNLKSLTISSTGIIRIGKNAFDGIREDAVFRLKMDRESYLNIRDLFEKAVGENMTLKRKK